MTNPNSYKMVFAGTFGDEEYFPEEFRTWFPNTKFFFHKVPSAPDTKPHPHECMVASRKLLALRDLPGEVHFVRWMDGDGETAEFELLDIIEQIQPTSVQNSWGHHPSLNASFRNIVRRLWIPWVNREEEMRNRIGYASVWAAGNRDQKRWSFPDVNFPQRDMEGVFIVGAHDRRGVMTEWTSDGKKVTCCSAGHLVKIFDPYQRKWVNGSGTSYTALIELYERQRILGDVTNPEEFHAWIVENTSLDYEGERIHHIKAGWGSVEQHYQDAVSEAGGWDLLPDNHAGGLAVHGEKLSWFGDKQLEGVAWDTQD